MVVVVGLVACGGSGGGDGNTAGNTAPVAEAGPDQNILTGSSVTLNGSGSSDANGDALTYNWSFTSKSAGSTATLSSSTVVNPTFTADKDGGYVLSLVVNDGKVSSVADTVKITAATANSAPVANAGPDQNILTGSSVTLNGSGSSDANGDALTYNWSFTSKPAGSTATLSSSTVSAPTFTADLAGSYVLSLVVNDGQMSSGTDTVTIIAVNPPQDVQFEQFEYRFAAGPCFPDADCFGFIVLASDGTLLNDKFGELPAGTVHTAKVTQAELDAAIPVLTETSLVELLDLPGQICEPPTDIFEDMILTMEGKTHSHTVTWCGDQPIVDARQVLNDLANRYFP
jgi:hypothetical protein